MALQILPSFGGVAVTLARPEGFASRAAEKRRKIPPFFRKKEEEGRIQPMAGHLTRQVPTKGRRAAAPVPPPRLFRLPAVRYRPLGRTAARA